MPFHADVPPWGDFPILGGFSLTSQQPTPQPSYLYLHDLIIMLRTPFPWIVCTSFGTNPATNPTILLRYFPFWVIFWCFDETSHPSSQWPWHPWMPVVGTSLGSPSSWIFLILWALLPSGAPIILFRSFLLRWFLVILGEHLTPSLNDHGTHTCQLLVHHWVHLLLEYSQFC